MASLAEIRAKLLAQQSRAGGGGNGGDNAMFPFWNIPEDSTTTIRLLPDGDETNTFFWRERQTIRIPFPGIKGGDTSREVNVQVPCMDMFGKPDPILSETKAWWDDEALKPLARTYWKKRAYIFQGFVRSSTLQEDNVPENPIRRFMINSTIFDIIKGALMDPEMEDMPVSYDNGVDFRITKTKPGQYADYKTSSWSRKTSSLTSDELAAIETHGLSNLGDFLPKEPTADGLVAIKEMFEASVEGEMYDPERWANFYRPYGVSKPESANSSSSAPKVESPKVESPKASVPDTAATALAALKAKAAQTDDDTPPANDANAVLELLRNRTKT